MHRTQVQVSPTRDLEIASHKPLATLAPHASAGVTPDAAREHLAIAKKMIAEMGYHRRDKKVQELERGMLDYESAGQ